MTGGLVDLRDWRFYRDVERLHALGPRLTYEMLIELSGAALCRTELDHIVARYVVAFGRDGAGFFVPKGGDE